MKISQVLESQQQLDELDATQVGQTAGTALGKTANALGAVAGGVKGAWDAAKAGFQQGKGYVSGQRVGATDPKAVNQAGPQGTAPAQAVQGAAGTAVGNMGKAMGGQKPAQAGQTLYTTVKSQINNIDPQSKQKLLNLVQKSIQQKGAQAGSQQSGAMAQMANALTGGGQQAPAQPNTMANAPVSATNTAQPGNPNAQAPAAAPAAEPNATGYNAKTGAALPADAPSKDQQAQIQAQRSAARQGGDAMKGGNFDPQTGEPIDLKTKIKNRMAAPKNTGFADAKAAATAAGVKNFESVDFYSKFLGKQL